MVNHCANPNCCKPLHYLREGRIYMFEVPDPAIAPAGGKAARRTEHFWLCGNCSETYLLEQNADRSIKITPKPIRPRHGPVPASPAALAS